MEENLLSFLETLLVPWQRYIGTLVDARYCRMLASILNDPAHVGKSVVQCTSTDARNQANAACLIGGFAIMFLGKSPEEAYRPLARLSYVADVAVAAGVAVTAVVADIASPPSHPPHTHTHPPFDPLSVLHALILWIFSWTISLAGLFVCTLLFSLARAALGWLSKTVSLLVFALKRPFSLAPAMPLRYAQ
jgi:hypothetical protein